MSAFRRESAFAFVELLVVMLICVVLCSVAVGPTASYLRGQKLTRCTENMRKLHLVLTLYANEHDGAFPKVEGAQSSAQPLCLLVPKYTSDPALIACPEAKGGFGYAYVSGLKNDGNSRQMLLSDGQVNMSPKSKDAPLFSTDGKGSGSNHGISGNVLFVDGHVETMNVNAAIDLTLPPGAVLLNP